MAFAFASVVSAGCATAAETIPAVTMDEVEEVLECRARGSDLSPAECDCVAGMVFGATQEDGFVESLDVPVEVDAPGAPRAIREDAVISGRRFYRQFRLRELEKEAVTACVQTGAGADRE